MTAVHLPSADEFEAFKLFMFRLIDAALWVFMLMGVLFLGEAHPPVTPTSPAREEDMIVGSAAEIQSVGTIASIASLVRGLLRPKARYGERQTLGQFIRFRPSTIRQPRRRFIPPSAQHRPDGQVRKHKT